MNKLIIISLLFLEGCAGLAIGAGAGGAVRDEFSFRKLEKQVQENNKIMEWLLDYYDLQTKSNN